MFGLANQGNNDLTLASQHNMKLSKQIEILKKSNLREKRLRALKNWHKLIKVSIINHYKSVIRKNKIKRLMIQGKWIQISRRMLAASDVNDRWKLLVRGLHRKNPSQLRLKYSGFDNMAQIVAILKR